jgi:hypothetical protein
LTRHQPFQTEEQAVRLANDTRYGLNAMMFIDNLHRAHRVAALNAGTVWVNCFFIRDLRAPFGGVGDSGVGREGGNFSREFFTEPKAIVMQITPRSKRGRRLACSLPISPAAVRPEEPREELLSATTSTANETPASPPALVEPACYSFARPISEG